ncbi:MAG: hypothetical protein JRJ84_05385 [Deltaproteobacteria bacterium]|nr:hypothetical protein [Deltaproteobacteria bacterium]
MSRIITITLLGALLLGPALPAHAVAPAESVRAAGNWGIGIGGGTAVSGFSGKYFLTNGTALQAIVGGVGHVAHDFGTDDDFGTTALGVDIDFLVEMPTITTVADVFELGWAIGAGAWTWIPDPFWLGINGVLGIEFNFIPIPLDVVLEYRPAIRVVPEVGMALWDFGVHVRFYFH